MATPVDSQASKVGERIGEAATGAAQKGWSGVQAVLDYELVHIGGVELTVGRLIAAVLALVVMLLVSRLVRHALDRYAGRHRRTDPASIYTVSRIAHYVLLAIGVVLALDLIGLPVGKFTVFAGALGVGLGFGLQAIFNNFVSGLILLFDKSLKIGDFVELEAGTRGTVRDIKIRATRITTNDNIDILVPNSEFVSGRVVNWTHQSTERRLRVPFSVAYGVDKELVRKAALEAASKVPFTQTMDGRHAPQVWLVAFGDSGVDFVLAVWLSEEAARRNAAIEAAYLWELDTALKAHGIEIPFPQQDIHIRSLFGLSKEDALRALRLDTGTARERGRRMRARRKTGTEGETGNDALDDVRRDIEESAVLADDDDAEAVAEDRQ